MSKRRYNTSAVYNGVRYDSRAEAQRARELDLRLAAGEIRFWLRQPKFQLGSPKNVYQADFLVLDKYDTLHAVDIRGTQTAKLKRYMKLWRKHGPCLLHIIFPSHSLNMARGSKYDQS